MNVAILGCTHLLRASHLGNQQSAWPPTPTHTWPSSHRRHTHHHAQTHTFLHRSRPEDRRDRVQFLVSLSPKTWIILFILGETSVVFPVKKNKKKNFSSCLCVSEMWMDSWASLLAANKLPSSWRDNNTALQRLGRPHPKVNVQNVKQGYKKHADTDFRRVVGQKQNALRFSKAHSEGAKDAFTLLHTNTNQFIFCKTKMLNLNLLPSTLYFLSL